MCSPLGYKYSISYQLPIKLTCEPVHAKEETSQFYFLPISVITKNLDTSVWGERYAENCIEDEDDVFKQPNFISMFWISLAGQHIVVLENYCTTGFHMTIVWY